MTPEILPRGRRTPKKVFRQFPNYYFIASVFPKNLLQTTPLSYKPEHVWDESENQGVSSNFVRLLTDNLYKHCCTAESGVEDSIHCAFVYM